MLDTDSPIPAWAWEIVRCPHTRNPLRRVDAELLARLRERQRQGRLWDTFGVPVTIPLDDGLVSACGTFFYPMIDRIPNLLPSDAIPLSDR
ncbi:MAG: hypothetical protein D6753_18950 [Planctomycetota bacterium]|nr:MAG: hypothetical protein D6753_18950 [Planctomycetota bacterium]